MGFSLTCLTGKFPVPDPRENHVFVKFRAGSP